MKQFKKKLAAALVTSFALLCCFPATVFAYSDESSNIVSDSEEADVTAEEPVIDRGENTEEGNPFTVDGNGQLQDQAESSQNKIFYTITTKNNNTYFLIIDKDRSSNNVYMLSMIDDADLAEFTEDTSEEENPDSLLTENEPLITESGSTESENEGSSTDTGTSEQEFPTVETEAEEIEKNTVSPVMILLIVILAVGVVAGYYILKIRPKKELEEEEDETAYGGEDQPDDEEEIEEPEETDEIPDAESNRLPQIEKETEASGNTPFQDYPDPDDDSDEQEETK